MITISRNLLVFWLGALLPALINVFAILEGPGFIKFTVVISLLFVILAMIHVWINGEKSKEVKEDKKPTSTKRSSANPGSVYEATEDSLSLEEMIERNFRKLNSEYKSKSNRRM
jgi:hypothetical protein